MAEDKLILAIASLLDAIRAMQRGVNGRAAEKLRYANKTLIAALEQRQVERLANLF